MFATFATIRRIALAIAGAAALVAASRARADDHYYPTPRHQAPAAALRFTLALPAPPAWLVVSPPPVPAYGYWTRAQLESEYRWLDRARVRFYRRGGWSPWRVRQFDAWYGARCAELDRRSAALAWAPAGRRGAGWYDRGSWERGRAGRERWERDD